MDEKDWLSLVIEEYKTAREESLDADNNAQSILKFGIAIIGVVISLGFNFWDKNPIPDFIFLVFNPILCYLILTMWIGEFARRIRVGHFIIEEVEKKVNRRFKKNLQPALILETWLRTPDEEGKTRMFKWNRYATIALLLVTAIGSIAIGNYKILSNPVHGNLLLINTFELLFFAAVVVFNYLVGKKLE